MKLNDAARPPSFFNVSPRRAEYRVAALRERTLAVGRDPHAITRFIIL
jgi:hypothetical protein